MAKRLSQGKLTKAVCEIVCLMAAVWALSATARPKVEVSVRPAVCLDPCSVEVRVKVPSHPEGSRLQVEIDGPGYYAGEERDIPDSTSLIQPTPFHDIPGGDYDIRATVVASGRTVASARTTLIVRGSEEP